MDEWLEEVPNGSERSNTNGLTSGSNKLTPVVESTYTLYVSSVWDEVRYCKVNEVVKRLPCVYRKTYQGWQKRGRKILHQAYPRA